MLTRTAGVELAPYNILVVGVGPGAIATPINLSTMKDPVLLAKLNAAIVRGTERATREHPLRSSIVAPRTPTSTSR